MTVQHDHVRRRMAMVREQLLARGIDDEQVLSAMGTVRRHLFVDEALHAQAYSENALPIGYGQTISQPYTVAQMACALQLEPDMRVLEVGTGSGYQAAVLAEMGAEVYSLERIKPLYLAALKRMTDFRYFRVKLKLADGTEGWPEQAPFDRILVTAGGPEVPTVLLGQLAAGGMLVMPVGQTRDEQKLVRIREEGGRWFRKELGEARFVDLIGRYARCEGSQAAETEQRKP
jgi:protein-L-isoaspartate(D-aspartate) O-methyltransferase